MNLIKIWIKRTGIATLVASTVLASIQMYGPTTVQAAVKSIDLGFESGNSDGWVAEFCCSHSGSVVTSPVRSGRYAARFEVRPGDSWSGSSRSELYTSPPSNRIPMGSEVWYGLSIYIPANHPIENKRNYIAQWHSTDNEDPNAGRTPNLFMDYVNGNLGIYVRHDPQRTQTSNTGTLINVYNKPITKGIWHDFIFRVKWSYQSDGLVDGWLDGTQIVDYNGPVGYNDTYAPYFKMGIYRSTTITNTYVFFHDAFRQGNSYQEVDPAQRQATPSPQPLCAHDYNQDRRRDSLDLIHILNNWNNPFTITDIIGILNTWGMCP